MIELTYSFAFALPDPANTRFQSSFWLLELVDVGFGFGHPRSICPGIAAICSTAPQIGHSPSSERQLNEQPSKAHQTRPARQPRRHRHLTRLGSVVVMTESCLPRATSSLVTVVGGCFVASVLAAVGQDRQVLVYVSAEHQYASVPGLLPRIAHLLQHTVPSDRSFGLRITTCRTGGLLRC